MIRRKSLTRHAACCVVALIALMLAGGAGAVTISLLPSTANVAVGGSFDVDVQFSGLGVGSAPSVGVFDLDILFDPSLTALTSVSFGDPMLGDQLALTFPALAVATSGVGMANVFELSFDLPATLDTGQADSFIAATLSFDALLTTGTVSFSTAVLSVGDADGASLPVDLVGASVDITDAIVPIPEPTAFLLFPLGLLVVARRSQHVRSSATLS